MTAKKKHLSSSSPSKLFGYDISNLCKLITNMQCQMTYISLMHSRNLIMNIHNIAYWRNGIYWGNIYSLWISYSMMKEEVSVITIIFILYQRHIWWIYSSKQLKTKSCSGLGVIQWYSCLKLSYMSGGCHFVNMWCQINAFQIFMSKVKL